jgi:hypothetical protein
LTLFGNALEQSWIEQVAFEFEIDMHDYLFP